MNAHLRSVLFVATLLFPAAAAGALTFELDRVADLDTPVPGGLPGETFSGFEVALTSGWGVAFHGFGDMGSDGIYLRCGAGLEVVVDLDAPVPGGTGGDAFTGLDSFSIDFCDVAYSAIVNGTDTAIFHKPWGAPAERVVDAATAVPGEPGATFTEVDGVWLSHGDMVFTGVHDVCLGAARPVEGVYFFDGASRLVSKIADDCSTAVPGGQTGEVFGDLSDVTPLLDGGSVTFSGTGDLGTFGVYTTLGGALRPVADQATDLPGGQPGEDFDDFGDVAPISGREIALLAAGTMGTIGIFRETGAGLEMLYDLADAPPGWLPGEGFDFAGREDGAFFCWHSSGVATFYGAGDQGSEGLYRTRGGEVAKVIAAGDAVAGGDTVSALSLVVQATNERIVFVAELDGTSQAVFLAREILFGDGFESGDTSAWSGPLR